MELKIKIKKLHKDAVIPFKKHDDDFCYDVTATSEEEVAKNVWKYGLGIALQIDSYHLDNAAAVDMLHSIDIRPRSSVWKTGMVLSNCEATIDSGYTGEISAVFYHVMPDMPRYKVGDRIGQLKVNATQKVKFVEVDELDETDRGEGAYGSTGK